MNPYDSDMLIKVIREGFEDLVGAINKLTEAQKATTDQLESINEHLRQQ